MIRLVQSEEESVSAPAPRTAIMAATTEELERRLAALEAEVARLRERLEPPPGSQPENAWEEMARRSRESQPALTAAWKKMLQDLGIPEVEPIPAEELQQMMIDEGIRPEDNILSSEIIRMREKARE
jgi:hypothetical protein